MDNQITAASESTVSNDIKEKLKIGIIALTIGIILIGIYGYLTVNDYTKSSEYTEVIAEVTNVDTDTTQHRVNGKIKTETHRIYTVKYSMNGKEYTDTLRNIEGSPSNGEQIKMYIDPENPLVTMSSPSITKRAGLAIGGVLVGAFGMLFITDVAKTNKQAKKNRINN